MPDYKAIYDQHAEQYDRLVAREDYQHNILRALQRIRPLDGLDVVEVGAGTGRMTCMLAPVVSSILAFDASRAMLAVAIAKLKQHNRENWRAAVADNRNLPINDGIADLAIAGWTFGHTTLWSSETWHDEIGRALREMRRVLRPGGTAIILETLGTGRETPLPPSEGLAAYYAMLEQQYGYAATSIRTDYRFESQSEAEELTRFFFGAVPEGLLIQEGGVIVPECTGIWWLTNR